MTHIVDTLSTEKSVELSLAFLARLEQSRRVGDLDFRVSQSCTSSSKSLVVSSEHFSADVRLVALNERLNVDRSQKQLVEAVVGSHQDLSEIRVGRAGGHLVGSEGEESCEKFDLRLVGGLGRDALLVFGGRRDIIVESGSRVVEVLGEHLGRDPC